jgi:beta-lactamase class A
VPVQTQVYNKTGSTARLCGDMGIVVPRTASGGTSPYIFVAIIERASRAEPYRSWLAHRSKVIREVSGLVYEHLKQSHDLL